MKAIPVVQSDSSTFRHARPPKLSKFNSILDLAYQMRGLKRVDTSTNLTEAAQSMRDFFIKWKRASSQSSIGSNHEEPLKHLIASHLLNAEGYAPAFSARSADSSLPSEASPALSAPNGLNGLTSIEAHVLLTLDSPTALSNEALSLPSYKARTGVAIRSSIQRENDCYAVSTCKMPANRSIFYRVYGQGAEKVLMVMGLAASHRFSRFRVQTPPSPLLRSSILVVSGF